MGNILFIQKNSNKYLNRNSNQIQILENLVYLFCRLFNFIYFDIHKISFKTNKMDIKILLLKSLSSQKPITGTRRIYFGKSW